MSRGQYDVILPYGLTTMLEGLSRAVLKKRPDNLKLFALYYLTELKKFKNGRNKWTPSLCIAWIMH